MFVCIPTKRFFFHLNEIRYVGISIGLGLWLMHASMPYDPIQGQGQGRGDETLKVCRFYIFIFCLQHHLQWERANDW